MQQKLKLASELRVERMRMESMECEVSQMDQELSRRHHNLRALVTVIKILSK